MMKKMLWPLAIGFCLNLWFPCSGKAEEAIKIAAIFAQTGEAAVDNAHSLQGARFAVNEINNQGGVLGKKIELLIFDNFSTPTGSKVAADKAVKEGAVAIIGSAWSSHSLVIAKVAQANHVPMITNVSTHPDVTRVGNYIFRTCFIDSFQGNALAKFMRNELKANTAVIMTNVSSDYSIGLAQEFRNNFEKMKGKVLRELKYIQKEQDFKELLQQVRQVSPDILFIPGYDESGIVVKQAQDIGIRAILVGGDGWGGAGFYNNGGGHLREAYFSTHWSDEIDRKNVRDFLQRYQGENRIIADTALAYDAVFLLADAIKRAGSLERDKIREALAQTKNFQGLTGYIALDEERNPIKSVVIIKIVNGKPHYYKTIEPF